ncbi:MAG: hypothetical protein ACRDBX_06545 [Erysipelotrichaceae bacterium]
MDVDQVINTIVNADKSAREKVDAQKVHQQELLSNVQGRKQALLDEYRKQSEEELMQLTKADDDYVDQYEKEEADKRQSQRKQLEQRFEQNKQEWLEMLMEQVTS